MLDFFPSLPLTVTPGMLADVDPSAPSSFPPPLEWQAQSNVQCFSRGPLATTVLLATIIVHWLRVPVIASMQA